jgi:hypothetical protein
MGSRFKAFPWFEFSATSASVPLLPSGPVSSVTLPLDAERTNCGHADKSWAVALACQRERGLTKNRGALALAGHFDYFCFLHVDVGHVSRFAAATAPSKARFSVSSVAFGRVDSWICLLCASVSHQASRSPRTLNVHRLCK